MVLGKEINMSNSTSTSASKQAGIVHEGPSVSIPASEVKFGQTGLKTEKGELTVGPAYGNIQDGRHGTFVRVPAGFVSPAHTHTEDYYAVVVEGVMANGAPEAEVVPLPAGSYYFQQGEEVHVTRCLSDAGCMFFMVQPGKFDFVPAK